MRWRRKAGDKPPSRGKKLNHLVVTARPYTAGPPKSLEADRERTGASDRRGPKALTGRVQCGDPTTDKSQRLAPAAQHLFPYIFRNEPAPLLGQGI